MAVYGKESAAYLNNTIALDISEDTRTTSAITRQAGGIDPGMLIKVKWSTPTPYSYFEYIRYDVVQPDYKVETLFATENILNGGTIITPYEQGTTVVAVNPRRGDMVLALVDEASAVAGEFLLPSGEGLLKRYSPAPAPRGYPHVGICMETYNLDAGKGELPPRLTKIVIL